MKVMNGVSGRIMRYWPVILGVIGLAFIDKQVGVFDEGDAVDSALVVQEEPSVLLHHATRITPGIFYREKLWLARCIYSETKRMHEQELVAWVVRNRYETRYRGKTSYKQVVLDARQFSAFNPGTTSRRFLTLLDTTYKEPKWQSALRIAEKVMLSRPERRPFSITTRHFYSERSMPNEGTPLWVSNRTPIVLSGYRVDARRFRFYDGVI